MHDKFSNANSQFRDSLFRDFFNEPARLLSLCNSLLNSHFSSINDIEINTLDTSFFSGLKNDISCKIGNNFLVLIEHQSSVNSNMPFRCLSYVAELLNNLVKQKKFLYQQHLFSFPSPRFFVFYDGDDKSEPVYKILKLSDAFNGDSSALELIVHSFNIKQGIGQGKIAQAEQTALKMLHKNLPLEQIADFTDLPISRIQQLANDPHQ